MTYLPDKADEFLDTTLNSVVFPGDLVEVVFLDHWGILSNIALAPSKTARAKIQVGQIGIVIKNLADEDLSLSDCFLVILEGRRVYLGEREIKIIQYGEGTPTLAQREKLLTHIIERRQKKFFKERVKRILWDSEVESDKIDLESSSLEKISEALLIATPERK